MRFRFVMPPPPDATPPGDPFGSPAWTQRELDRRVNDPGPMGQMLFGQPIEVVSAELQPDGNAVLIADADDEHAPRIAGWVGEWPGLSIIEEPDA